MHEVMWEVVATILDSERDDSEIRKRIVMRQVMCDCVYMCTIIVVGMYKNHCLVASAIMVGESAIYYACIPSVCILHIMHITRV